MPTTEAEISSEDREKILASARDYIESWLDGDAARMARCLHPELAKREVSVHPETGACVVETLSRDQMIRFTEKGHGKKYERPYDISILDAFGDIATVRVLSSAYMDHVQVARFGSEWLLLNVLWQRRPGR
jgi:hypothetical protein